jgi:hypothetical protein
MAAYAVITLNTAITTCAGITLNTAISTSTYRGNSIVILAKRRLWHPDDGLCKPKHVGVAFVILIVLII